MRIYGILTFIAVLMAFLAGYLSLALKSTQAPQIALASQVLQLKRDFQNERKFIAKISPLSVYPTRDVPQLLAPESVLPQTHKYKFATIRLLYFYSLNCKKSPRSMIELQSPNEALRKELTWQQFLCSDKASLPETFFEKPPYISPFGGSYAFLALNHVDKLKIGHEWIEAHLPYFHATELGQATRGLENVPALYKIIGQLDDAALKGISNKDSLVLSPNHVLIQEKNSSGGTLAYISDTTNTYRVFARHDWDNFIGEAPIVPTATIDNSCLQKDGQLCWVANEKTLYQRFQNPSLFLFGGSILLTALSVILIFTKIRSQRIEQERKRFALQTLTHELRTPISSLVVSTEAIINQYDSIPKHFQSHLLRIANDTQRLRRLAEISSQYLSAHRGNKTVDFKWQKVDSINEYVEKILEPYREKVAYVRLPKDHAFTLDPYWVGISIKNLIENAITHGEPPVKLSLQVTGNYLEVVIEDGGTMPLSVVSEIGQPFWKGNTSAGLGLGLSIVKTVIEDMRGEFIFENSPTRFGFRIGNSS